MSIKIDRIVVSDKFNYNKDGFKHFIDYQKGKLLDHYVLFYLK